MQKYSPISDATPNMREDSESGAFCWHEDVAKLERDHIAAIAELNVRNAELRKQIAAKRDTIDAAAAGIAQRDAHIAELSQKLARSDAALDIFHSGAPMRLLKNAVDLFGPDIDPAIGFERELQWLKDVHSLMEK